jgi:Ca2+-binding RTX toxin-like protein
VKGQVAHVARRVAVVALTVLVTSAATGTLASNVVATSRVGEFAVATGANDLKPLPECAGITLQTVFTGSGSFNSNNSDELVVGSALNDTIGARNGDDCVVGGSGNDSINGGVGLDVCIGGLGTDTFTACEVTIQ